MLRDKCASALVKLQRGEGLTVGGPVWAVLSATRMLRLLNAAVAAFGTKGFLRKFVATCMKVRLEIRSLDSVLRVDFGAV